jgi:tetratricopeptide (TPR) repeat protein
LFGTTGIVSVICRAWITRCLAQLGNFSDAICYGDEAIKIALESNHPYSIVYAYYGAGVLFLIKGEFDKAAAVLISGLEVCQSADIPVMHPLISSCLGAAYAFLGRLDEALQLLENAVRHTESMRRRAGQALRMAWLSEAYILASRTDEAETFARRGLELARESNDRGSQAWLLRNLGELINRRSGSDLEQAEENYREALRLAQELAMRPLQAHCHFGLASVYAKMKKLTKARSELDSAAELYRTLSMPFWLSKADFSFANLS